MTEHTVTRHALTGARQVGRRAVTRLMTRMAIIVSMTLVAAMVGWLSAPATASAASAVSLYAWGDDASGQLGDAGTANQPSPEAITLAAGVTPTAVSAGSDHSMAIGSDGKLYAWGANGDGELGDGTTTAHDRPEVITLAAGVLPESISAGSDLNQTGDDSLAIGSDGKLYAWGDNDSGQLGNGTTTNQDVPQVITLAAGVTPKTISAGGGSTLAIGSNGELYAWGDNESGQLGDGTTVQQDRPEAITLAAGVAPKTVVASTEFSLAIGSDGQMYAWGYNGDCELGDGTHTDRHTPEVVTLASGVTPTQVAAGLFFGTAIGSDGRVYTWGNNAIGELGDGGETNSARPVKITLHNGVSATSIAAGGYHALAIGSNGDLYAWGYNSFGQLGDGTYTDQDVPEEITAATGTTSAVLSGGELDTLVLASVVLASVPAVDSISPASGTTAGGTSVTIAGTALTGASKVLFGTVPATSYTVVSPTEITAVAPAQDPSTHNILVTTPGGTSGAVAGDLYTYGPSVTGISPTSGPSAGGTTVTVTGVGFTGATKVTFGTVAAPSFTVVSATEIKAVSPAQAPSTHNIMVTTPEGTSPVVAADQFSYNPAVTVVVPDGGPLKGGTSVTIYGTGFTGATRVDFGTVAATSFSVVSDTEITAVSPAQASQTHNIFVTTPGGTSAAVAADQFSYVVAPTVTGVSPDSGTAATGINITITGTGFATAYEVLFGTQYAGDVKVVSPTEMTVVDPPQAAGVHNVYVISQGGQSAAVAADRFTYT